MRVSVELPDPKPHGLDAAVAKQFADIQRQLLSLISDKERSSKTMHSMMLEHLEAQQSTLVKAMERLMGMVGALSPDATSSDALSGALQGLKQTLSNLPGDLKDALDRSYQRAQGTLMKAETKPSVTVRMPQGLMTRIDSLEAALLNGLRRSRSRTFGSNY